MPTCITVQQDALGAPDSPRLATPLLVPRLGFDESHGAGVPQHIAAIQGIQETKELNPKVFRVLGIVFLKPKTGPWWNHLDVSTYWTIWDPRSNHGLLSTKMTDAKWPANTKPEGLVTKWWNGEYSSAPTTGQLQLEVILVYLSIYLPTYLAS